QHLAWSLENIIEGNPVNVIKVPQKEATLAKLALNKMLEVS
ncbi:MAG: quinolinate synthase NadA, partial [Nitrosomonadales bacterium]|nr:quinolinate synthase NadA [Nitrosomonadales bacterium]MBT3917973.1 quinolinate synthase NadA [Nitrosomonadales bacterium]MBT4571195.1 quinolinate synthase NadA [Nitrosomonadales bacterium]MBT4759120.1 quinolinate synthase NadA [Nitrosomonadales bacterium]MBT5149619.1 quinolinate synthase NadA [Nitrosomonadales bacterium]